MDIDGMKTVSPKTVNVEISNSVYLHELQVYKPQYESLELYCLKDYLDIYNKTNKMM